MKPIYLKTEGNHISQEIKKKSIKIIGVKQRNNIMREKHIISNKSEISLAHTKDLENRKEYHS